jgi:hypothetical protein
MSMTDDLTADIIAAAVEARIYAESAMVILETDLPSHRVEAAKMLKQSIDAALRLQDLVIQLRE